MLEIYFKNESNRYITDNHWIKLFDKSILNEIEEKYNY